MILAFYLIIAMSISAYKDMGHIGDFPKWSKVEVQLSGPMASVTDDPNPFKIKVDVIFQGPDGRRFVVPAFYDGDGRGEVKGNVWKARFSPDKIGLWTFSSRSTERSLDGYRGSFKVLRPPEDAPKFYRWGRLRYVGEHYLKFMDGPYWIKGGTDEPEEFLGEGVMGDWEGKKRAIDYLAGKGVNSIYIMLHNVLGDYRNVCPWLMDPAISNPVREQSERFDLPKLARWEELFGYIQSKGIVLHLVLEDDSAWTGFNRELYYREMVARFSHHPAIIWNLGEEFNENYSFEEAVKFLKMLRDLDPYDHPVTVHNVNDPKRAREMVEAGFDLTSIQTSEQPPSAHNSLALSWWRNSESAGKPLVVSFDEGRPATDRRNVWAVYMGGGMWEAIAKRVREGGFEVEDRFWDEMRYARDFMEDLPLWKMEPRNDLVEGEGTYCFAAPGELYAVYTGKGDRIRVDLSGASGIFKARWFNPRRGKFERSFEVKGGGKVELKPPDGNDWALLIWEAQSHPADSE
jgi:hypothetical protein